MTYYLTNIGENKMATTRICDACGKERKLEYGKTCSTGHFICSYCRGDTSILSTPKKSCPICKKDLR